MELFTVAVGFFLNAIVEGVLDGFQGGLGIVTELLCLYGEELAVVQAFRCIDGVGLPRGPSVGWCIGGRLRCVGAVEVIDVLVLEFLGVFLMLLVNGFPSGQSPSLEGQTAPLCLLVGIRHPVCLPRFIPSEFLSNSGKYYHFFPAFSTFDSLIYFYTLIVASPTLCVSIWVGEENWKLEHRKLLGG